MIKLTREFTSLANVNSEEMLGLRKNSVHYLTVFVVNFE